MFQDTRILILFIINWPNTTFNYLTLIITENTSIYYTLYQSLCIRIKDYSNHLGPVVSLNTCSMERISLKFM